MRRTHLKLQELLRTLKDRQNITNLCLEMNHGSQELLDEYSQTGDEEVFQQILKGEWKMGKKTYQSREESNFFEILVLSSISCLICQYKSSLGSFPSIKLE